MSAYTLLLLIVVAWLAIAVAVFGALFFVTAPYGRYARGGWGPALPSCLGWLLMEAPAVFVFAAGFVVGSQRGVTAWVFFCLWQLHYVYRAFVYPFTLRDDGRRMPLSVVGMAIAFNAVNAGLNAWWLFELSGGYPTSWLRDPRFLAGTVLFLAGMVVNRRADLTLRGLRRQGLGGYRVPEGDLYRWVSCPNYFGEIVEWVGWALATWSLPGLGFAVWTAANLVPRARANHRWYREHFADYPPQRRALLPGVW